MTLKIAIQMNDIKTIDVKGDSSFALLLEAQKRYDHIIYYLPDALTLHNQTLTAQAQNIKVKDSTEDYVSLGEKQNITLADYDVVLMRQDPPFDMHYLTATYLLEKIHPQTYVVNNPREVRNAPEKIFVTEFAQFMPPTLITRNHDEIKHFHRTYKEIILKPLYGNGGEGVIHIGKNDRNLNAITEMFNAISPNPYIVQKYQAEVRKGDKRIILLNGKPIGAVNRVPHKQDNRSNMHVGGKAQKTTLTKNDHEICAAIGPELKKRGLILVGIDIIGDKLTEINVTSPTGLREIKKFDNINIARHFWDVIEEKIQK